MKKLFFKDKDNNEIAKIEATNNNPGQDMQLNEGEQIIESTGTRILPTVSTI